MDPNGRLHRPYYYLLYNMNVSFQKKSNDLIGWYEGDRLVKKVRSTDGLLKKVRSTEGLVKNLRSMDGLVKKCDGQTNKQTRIFIQRLSMWISWVGFLTLT